MENYYSSPQLFDELFYRETYACGTSTFESKGNAENSSQCQVETPQISVHEEWPLTLSQVEWSQKKKKKAITILSTIHSANELLTKKKDRHGNRIPKPVCIHQYTKNMSGVDISDQYLSHHVAMRKSMKWSQKLFFHLFNMIILNSYILNKKLGGKCRSKISLNILLRI